MLPNILQHIWQNIWPNIWPNVWPNVLQHVFLGKRSSEQTGLIYKLSYNETLQL